MEAQESFEYDKYLINLRASEDGSTVSLEVVPPDRESLFAGEQKLTRFNKKTFVAGFNKTNDKLSVQMVYHEADRLLLTLTFSDPLVG